jgi:hypothetical protein
MNQDIRRESQTEKKSQRERHRERNSELRIHRARERQMRAGDEETEIYIY